VRCPKDIDKSLRQHCGLDSQAIEKLHIYTESIQKWQKAINLVSPSTLPILWQRHILDSAQLVPLIKQIATQKKLTTTITDLGSGGGLPALVLAMSGFDHVTMIESDLRKTIFMREVSRETSTSNVTFINERIESATVSQSSFVTARALAPLSQLIEWGKVLMHPMGAMIFLKGQEFQSEINVLTDEDRARITTVQSLTDPKSAIIIYQ
jgi:16S rRNA (guanine527-N7)-methyltransferase